MPQKSIFSAYITKYKMVTLLLCNKSLFYWFLAEANPSYDWETYGLKTLKKTLRTYKMVKKFSPRFEGKVIIYLALKLIMGNIA